MWPDSALVANLLRRGSRRMSVLAALLGGAAGAGVAAVFAALVAAGLVPVAPSIVRVALVGALAIAIAAALAALVVARRVSSPRATALMIERRAVDTKNIVVTAAELMDDPARARPYVGAIVVREAARVAVTVDLARLFPAKRPASALAAGLVLWGGALALIAARPEISAREATIRAHGASIGDVTITVTPPTYSGRPAETFRNPARVVALVGSMMSVSVAAESPNVSMETPDGHRVLTPDASHADRFSATVPVNADGFVAFVPAGDSARAGARRLIGVSAIPDRPPHVRISAPGRDLFYPDGHRSLAVTLDADDDIGLASLALAFTRVTGSGEQFTFTEGRQPLTIKRLDAKHWTATASWDLSPLKLAAGDMVVYHGVAADARPGAIPVESDAFIVEITAPGDVAASGFAVDDEFDKYALSQQMVILKTQKLIARKDSIPADTVRDESLSLAAEQRAVRGLFVFMMGGEMADQVVDAAGLSELHEEGEAQGEGDLAAGRMANKGSIALITAIRSMSQANTALVNADLVPALADEKTALTALQGAFARDRYILRALTERERLDMTRRLTGTLTEASADVGPRPQPLGDSQLIELRGILSALAAATRDSAPDGRVALLAQSVLEIDAASPALQSVSTHLAAAASAPGGVHGSRGRAQLDSASTALAATIRARMPAGVRTSEAGLDALRGALDDALRRTSSGPPR